ncbi:MAG: DUF928 domain-containing protein [Acaryochloridaceae cyanobacterium RU_4_10]|nr:DUF928 domain-containing protein [Acaryochloridaceae cyanobacterium RU_4_10]
MSTYRPFFKLMTVGLLLIFSQTTLAAPLPSKTAVKKNRVITRVIFRPPLSNKRPDRTTGAGTRDSRRCQKSTPSTTGKNLPLMALVPMQQSGGLTLSERPTFWVYLPENSAKQVVLNIQEQEETLQGDRSEPPLKPHSQTFFTINGASGLMGLTPSETSPPFKIGKTYKWAMVLVCEKVHPDNPVVTAWVQRVAPVGFLKPGPALAQASWYGEQGLWYDTLTALAQTKLAQTPDLPQVWDEFLKSGGLEPIPMDAARSYFVALP